MSTWEELIAGGGFMIQPYGSELSKAEMKKAKEIRTAVLDADISEEMSDEVITKLIKTYTKHLCGLIARAHNENKLKVEFEITSIQNIGEKWLQPILSVEIFKEIP